MAALLMADFLALESAVPRRVEFPALGLAVSLRLAALQALGLVAVLLSAVFRFLGLVELLRLVLLTEVPLPASSVPIM